MSNTYGISEEVEKEIRARDKVCVFCHRRFSRESRASIPTIEHFNNDGPMAEKYNLAICWAVVIRAKERRSSRLGSRRLTVEKGKYTKRRSRNR